MLKSTVLISVLILATISEIRGVTFTYLTSYNRNGTVVREQDLEKTSVNVLKKVIFLISSYENHPDNWYINLTTEYFTKDNFNIYVVKWDSADDGDDLGAQIETAAQAVGDFMRALINKTQERFIDYHLVGVAEGVVVAEKAAKRLLEVAGRRVNRVTALDPGCSLVKGGFEGFADFEDAVHSGVDAGELSSQGHVDFYVYSVPTDRGVKICDGQKSLDFFATSIRSNNLKAVKCASVEHFLSASCAQNELITFGENVDKNVRGAFILGEHEFSNGSP